MSININVLQTKADFCFVKLKSGREERCVAASIPIQKYINWAVIVKIR